MLQLSKGITPHHVFSLRASARVGKAEFPVINPNNLKIEGFYCVDRYSKKTKILLTSDIRDMSIDSYIVNDNDSLTDTDELVRLKEILDLRFELIGKIVVTTNKKRLGKVIDFATETKSMYIQKIYVGQSVLRSLTGGQLGIDRSQIVEITPRRIIVKPPIEQQRVEVGAKTVIAASAQVTT
jgi:sporulation protein YlmC with PRC-barrel domain